MTDTPDALAEREAIVAWLRGPETMRYAYLGYKDEAYACLMAAYDIGRGEHLKGKE
jgi:hypothetical protein